MRFRSGRVACVLALAACGGGGGAEVTLTDGVLTAVVHESPAAIDVSAGGEIRWQTTAGARIDGEDAPPLGFGGASTGGSEVVMLYGAFKFDDRHDPWAGIERLSELVAAPDGRSATFAWSTDAADGTGTVTITNGGYVRIQLASPTATRLSLAGTCQPGEHFAGLGGQSWNVDHRGQTARLWVQEDGIQKNDFADDDYIGLWQVSGRRHSTHTPMPMALSSDGYAVILDTDARATFALCSEAEGVARFETWSPTLDLQVFVGADRSVRDAQAQMVAWTGRPPPPPAFAFAPWVDAIFGEDNVRRVAQRLRADGVAASVIWTEDWRGGGDGAGGYALDEDWRVDPALYPNFAQLADDLHGLGYKLLTYNNTFLDETADVYAEAVAGAYAIRDGTGAPYLFDGVRFTPSTLLDLTSGPARTWAKEVMGEGLALGADGWMADFAEWLPHDAVLASGEDALGRGHNRYPVEWAALNQELLAEQTDGVERLTFVRAAWLRSQPLVQVLWMGDQQTDFTDGDGLPSVIPMMIGLGVTGFPYVGSDIAGYMSQLTVPTTEELWYRWVTFGALSPVMRTHHGRSARVNYQWEADAGSVAHFRRWTRLHMQLVPYFTGLAEIASTTGVPLVRLTALEFPAEDWAWTATDQYMLGDRILVAPVVRAGAVSRTVHLPPGDWAPLLGGAHVAGGRDAEVAAPVAEIPALVPAGSLIAVYPDGVDTLVDAPDAPSAVTPADVGEDRDVWIYAGSSTTTNAWTDGARTWTWSGRDAALPAPTTATFEGAPVAVTAAGADVIVELDGPGTLAFDGGGTVTITGGAQTAHTTVRLR